ncbi:MAG: flavodoxin domain-containing protein [Intestinibacter sp.]|uniref:flavodoxin domain-containing protein n=1 Tax=Intestinibacter sp. TaxID=1965304 RepID=UPI003F16EBEC
MKAIAYTSNTGTTKAYAELLGKKISLPVYSLDEAKQKIKHNDEIIYLGWIMASGVKGYKEALKNYKICAVCAVGMGATGTQIKEVREKNNIADFIPVFTLQGGFDIKKLHGFYKIMMMIMVKTAGKELSKKTDRTLEEDRMLEMMLHGGDYVSEENLKAVLEWYVRGE